MAHPTSIFSAGNRSEAEARRQGVVNPSQHPPHVPEAEAPTADALDAAVPALDAAAVSSNAAPGTDLPELSRQFNGLTRLLDEITAVGKGMPRGDVDAMMTPVFGVLRGVMNRIIGAPAATLSELGIKAQVVMWGNRDWWEADAKLGWQEAAMKAFVEQTVSAAGLKPAPSSLSRSERSDTAA